MKKAYELHGGDVYRNDVKYDFSVNINPLPIPKKVKKRVVKAIDLSKHYPDPYCEDLCREIAKIHGVNHTEVLMGNGAAELIYGFCYAMAELKKSSNRPFQGLTLSPSFLEYERAVLAAGGEITYYPLKKENRFMLTKDFLNELKKGYDVLFLCNPNNPTGKRIDKELLIAILDICQKQGIYVCLDECFLPFARAESMDSKILENPYLLILRSFTKLYAIPGIRVGYALCNSELCKLISEKLQPWNVSVLASEAALACLEELDYVSKSLVFIDQEKKFLLEHLKVLEDQGHIKLYGYDGNFIFFEDLTSQNCANNDAKKNANIIQKSMDKLLKKEDLQSYLLKKKISIRNADTFTSLEEEHFYRIGIKTEKANKKLIQYMEKYYD